MRQSKAEAGVTTREPGDLPRRMIVLPAGAGQVPTCLLVSGQRRSLPGSTAHFRVVAMTGRSRPSDADDPTARNSNLHRVAMLPGDGIGPEVMPVGVAAIKAAADRCDLSLHIDAFDWSCAEYYSRHGAMLPPDWQDVLGTYEAIYFGAVGAPHVVPDHVAI